MLAQVGDKPVDHQDRRELRGVTKRKKVEAALFITR